MTAGGVGGWGEQEMFAARSTRVMEGMAGGRGGGGRGTAWGGNEAGVGAGGCRDWFMMTVMAIAVTYSVMMDRIVAVSTISVGKSL